jgi:membrane fusion protein, multidrug efflux system
VREGRAEAVSVETGLRTRDAVQILSGVEDGDQVVLTGFQQLRDGMEVETVEVEPDLPPEAGLGASSAGPATQEGFGG